MSFCFLSIAGAKLFQQRYEISRCWPRAGGTRAARMPARPPPAVVRKLRRLVGSIAPPSFRFRRPDAPAQNGGASVDNARRLSRRAAAPGGLVRLALRARSEERR